MNCADEDGRGNRWYSLLKPVMSEVCKVFHCATRVLSAQSRHLADPGLRLGVDGLPGGWAGAFDRRCAIRIWSEFLEASARRRMPTWAMTEIDGHKGTTAGECEDVEIHQLGDYRLWSPKPS
jgi:hypothetical protein